MSAASNLTFQATGRRKNAVARVQMKPGNGKIIVNNRAYDDYFPSISMQNGLIYPFHVANCMKLYDLTVNAKGGGPIGQLGAIRLATARALVQADPALRPALKKEGLMRRDPRMKERKKAGRPGARKRFQFSKR